MRITLAYPVEGIGGPDETVEVDETTGRRLLGDGFARPASPDADEETVPTKARSRKARSTRKPPADGTPPEHEGGQ